MLQRRRARNRAPEAGLRCKPGTGVIILTRVQSVPLFTPGASAADGRVVLISCYELGHEPLGIVVPAGVLARAGIVPRTMDVAVDEFDAAAITGAQLVAISTPMHTALRLGVRVAARVRALNPAAHICFYGLYAGLNARHLVPAHADSCLGAESEASLLELASAVLGAVHPRSVALPSPTPAARARDRALDFTPYRASQTRHDRYVMLDQGGARSPVGYIPTTRGCKHLCRHCPLPAEYAGSFYAIPVARVLDDVAEVVARGARHVTFADADFLNGPTHALRVARELHRRFAGVSFDYTAKIEHLCRHRDVVRELRDLGSLFVVSAVESFNDAVLRHLDKGHTREQALEAIRFFGSLGIALRPSLMPFTPWETRASLGELLDIVASEGLVGRVDPVQYSIRLLVPEGSLLLRHEPMRAHLGPFDVETLSYRWYHSDPEMDRLQRELARVAADAAAGGWPAENTFARVCAVVAPDRGAYVVRPNASPSPRLTEDWFC